MKQTLSTPSTQGMKKPLPQRGGVGVGYSPMKTLLVSLTLLLSSTALTMAQDFYLPVSTKSKTAKAAYYKADELSYDVHFDAANAQLDKALAEDPNFFMALTLRYRMAPADKKAAVLEKALAIDAGAFTEAEKIMRRQLVKWAADPKAKSEESMNELVAAYPKTTQAYVWASMQGAYNDRDKEWGLEYAQKLADMKPKFAPNYNTLGYLYMQRQQMDQAKAAFEKQIALAPKEANAYDSMAEYYMTAKDYAKSAEYYDKAAEMGLAVAKTRADKARDMMKQK